MRTVMLSDQVLELLTAFVDGELSQRHREEVMRLLNKSSEARDIVRQLQENAHRLKALPKRKVEPSLVAEIVQAIADQKAMPKPRVARRRWLPYVAATMAASLLIATLSFLYWKHMIDPNGDDNSNIARIEQPENKPNPQPQQKSPPTREPNPLIDSLVQGAFGEFRKEVPFDPPFSATFADIRDGKKTPQLVKELAPDQTIQLDVTVKNNKGAMDRLKDVLKDRGIALITDPSATRSLADKSQAKVEYLVYAENLTPDEVTKLMGKLGESYVVSVGMNERKVDDQYKKVTVAPAAREQKQKVFTLLGNPTDPKEVKPMPGQGRQALLLPTLAPKTPSKEVAQFVNKRQAHQPGTIQIVIKIRQE